MNRDSNVAKQEDGMWVHHFKNTLQEFSRDAAEKQAQLERQRQLRLEEGIVTQADREETVRPLTEQLGAERILRTSTLVPVPDICCTE